MNRQAYMEELKGKLGRMSERERMDAISYYEEYFDEAGPENEQEVIKNLGTPTQVSRQILADYAMKESVAKPASPKKGLWAAIFVILAILASPIAFPLALVAIILVFVAVLLVGIFIFTGVVVVASVGFAGVMAFIASFGVLATNPATGLFGIGVGILFVGLCLLCGVALYGAVVKGMPILTGWINKGLNRIQRRGKR